ncbi:MAG: glycosyltransferase [Desulfobacteraceae bacterium]|nr:glycosyltransferase [Desulfobacteraceae bacterium]
MNCASPLEIRYDFAEAAHLYSHHPLVQGSYPAVMAQAFEMAVKGQWADAAAQFSAAASSQYAYSANLHAGLCHLINNQLVAAAEAFENAGRIEFDTFDLHLYSGIVDHLLGLKSKANGRWWAARQIEKNDTINALAMKYFRDGLHPEASALYPLCRGKGIDVGCGSHKVHAKAIGIDITPPDRHGNAGCENGRMSQADLVASGDALPIRDETLDYVVARHNLEHYDDPILALMEWQRVLKPGGALGLVVPDQRYRNTIQLDPTHKHVFTPSSLRRILELMKGFDIIYMDALVCRWSFLCVAQKRPEAAMQRLDYAALLHDYEAGLVRHQAMIYRQTGFDALAEQCEQYIHKSLQKLGSFIEQHVSQPDKTTTIGQSTITPVADQNHAIGLEVQPSKSAAPRVGTGPLYLGLVRGDGYGWGVCSRYLIQELSKILPVVVVNTDDGTSENSCLDGTLFQALMNIDFDPTFPKARGRHNFGYAFFENELTQRSVDNARCYDLVLGGSTWNRERMLERGIPNCGVLIQGIDPEIFYPIESPAASDRFAIFSGGKFELRKGQDLVLRAVKIMQDKYPDVWLVNCWYNLWPGSTRLMSYSRHIRFQHLDGEPWINTMQRTYAENGLDPGRIITHELVPQKVQRELYAATDIGLFPNRCEGGTNLVLMEYMACAKPVIASNSSGHKDIVNDGNALLLNHLTPFNVVDAKGELIGRWQEPSLDELVSRLEYAYHHRHEIKRFGRQAGEDLKKFTWARSARQLIELMGG